MTVDRSVTARSNGTSAFVFNKSDKGGGVPSGDRVIGSSGDLGCGGMVSVNPFGILDDVEGVGLSNPPQPRAPLPQQAKTGLVGDPVAVPHEHGSTRANLGCGGIPREGVERSDHLAIGSSDLSTPSLGGGREIGSSGHRVIGLI